MADHATLGHYLPYLLRRRLQAVVWPDDGGARTFTLFILVLMMAYGAGLGTMLNNTESVRLAKLLPQLLIGLNAMFLTSALLVDFLPTLRPVTRPVPEHFPVSARQNVVTAFLLDLITVRRLILMAALLATLAVAPRHALIPGFSLLLILGAAALSFNVRLLFVLRRWRHPLLGLHVLSFALMLGWLATPTAPYHTELGVGMALLPWVLWAAQLYWVAPYFSTRYLPDDAAAATSQVLDRLPLEWKVYARKVWLPLLIGLLFKLVLLVITGLFQLKNGKLTNQTVFYLGLLPAVGFTYVNNNLFGFLGPLAANELQRLGLTSRLLKLYLRLALPVVLVECLLSAILLLGLFPTSFWPLLGLLPLSAAMLLSIGLWGSLYQAKPVIKSVDFANMRNNTSQWMSLCTIGLSAILYFLPWWWLRIALALLVAASAALPMRRVLHNDGNLRRRLWRGIGA